MSAKLAAVASAPSEVMFSALVEALVADPGRHDELSALLQEDHPLYAGRGTTAIVRMRGWVLLALSRIGLSHHDLLPVLGELDTGTNPYVVAAAARALRSHAAPTAAFAPFVLRALTNLRYQDEPLSFEQYGGYAVSNEGTSAVRELLETLVWLGAHARDILPQLEALCADQTAFSSRMWHEVDRARAAVRAASGRGTEARDACCAPAAALDGTRWWPFRSRVDRVAIEHTAFEDQDGAVLSFRDFFVGQPSVVVFFYTRCDNPLKCSLSITKLGRVQRLLAARGVTGQVHTAGITYDPGFDLPHRLRAYGRDRGLQLNAANRLLRAADGIDAVRQYFALRVNFVGSLVNWHRTEAYVLDAEGRIAAAFERLLWDEQRLVDRAVEVLKERSGGTRADAAASPPPGEEGRAAGPPERPPSRSAAGPQRRALPLVGTASSLAVAFLPKCPLCWAAYLSALGIAGVERVPYAPWLLPVFVTVMLIHLTITWRQARSSGARLGFWVACAGASAVAVSRFGSAGEHVGFVGVALILGGSLLTAMRARRPLSPILPEPDMKNVRARCTRV